MGGSFTDRALEAYTEGALRCVRLTPRAAAYTDDEIKDTAHTALDKHTQKWRSKGHKLRGGIARARFRRARPPRPPRENGCMSCGSKRACRKHTITREESIAWGIANCGGGRARKKGGPVGGNYSDARRAAGLWDADHPVDEGDVPGRASSRYSPGDPNAGYKPPPNAGPDGQPIGDGSAMTWKSTDWQSARALGYLPCQTPGSTTNCFDPRSGINRSWSVVGRHFTPAELATFQRTQCTPTCDSVPASYGAPADAIVKVRRVAPRNPAVKRRINCGKRSLSLARPSFELKPLPNITPTPGAIATPRACVPDTVIGVDGGMFGSGWWIVIRGGQRLLVPNPECCGTDCTAAFR